VRAHVIPSGGAFGRRLFWDPVQVAAYISKATGHVCKLMYHRSDDIRHTRLRPPQVHKVRATLLAGSVVTYEQHIAAVRLDARHGYGEKGTATTGSFPPGMPQQFGNMNYEQFFFKTMVASPYNYGTSTKVLTPVTFDWNTVSYRSVHIQPARCVEEIITEAIALMVKAGLTVQDGLPIQASYHHYHWPRMKDFPKTVDVIVMPNVGDPIAGMCEPGMSAPSGAIANAYARATGIKPRKFLLNA